jgi:hypothetical protein
MVKNLKTIKPCSIYKGPGRGYFRVTYFYSSEGRPTGPIYTGFVAREAAVAIVI